MTPEQNIAAKLDELINIQRASLIPIDHRWLDAAGVAAMLGYSADHVRQRLACLPGFPKASRPNNGNPRWKASEVERWMERQKKN